MAQQVKIPILSEIKIPPDLNPVTNTVASGKMKIFKSIKVTTFLTESEAVIVLFNRNTHNE